MKKRDSILKGTPIEQEAERAVRELQDKTSAVAHIFPLAKAAWSLDQDEGTIKFVNDDGFQAAAPAQIIGTYNSSDGSWLWGWDHPSVVEPLRLDALKMLEYGRQHHVPVLTTRKLGCTEDDCWCFTALACKIAGAQGAYRGPSGPTLVFMTFGELQLSKLSRRPK